MKNLGFALIVFLVLVALLYYFFYSIETKLKFKFDNLAFDALNLGGILGGTADITTTVALSVESQANISFSVSHLRAKIYYQGFLVAQSTDSAINNNSIAIAPVSTTNFSNELLVQLNSTTVDLIKSLRAKNPTPITFSLSMRIFGIFPFVINGDFVING